MAGRGTCCGAAQAEPGALGGAAPAKAGAGGEDALVGSQAWTHWWEARRGSGYISWLRWRRTRADIAAAPVRTGAGAAVPVEDRRRRTSKGPQAES